MNSPLRGLILLAILVSAAGSVPVFAYCPPDCAPKANYQPSSNGTFATNYTSSNSTIGTLGMPAQQITVITDKPSYNDGDKITVSGTTSDYISGTPIAVIIRNPIGNVVYISQVDLGTDKTYSTTIASGGSLWQAAGTYTVFVQFGSQDRSAKVAFEFTGSKGQAQPQNTIPVDGTNFSLSYTITNGKVIDIKADTQSKSLIVSIQTTGDGVLTITLPRALIDAQVNGQDDQFFVLNDGQEANFQEINKTSTDRTLSIPFTDGTQQIEIIGTQIVPEFGPIAALVLAIAIISIIAVSAKTGQRFIPKY
jgi:predicted secreted protein with PEFG-CTERM motif